MTWNTVTIALLQSGIGLVVGAASMAYVGLDGEHTHWQSRRLGYIVLFGFVGLMILLRTPEWEDVRRLIEVLALLFAARVLCLVNRRTFRLKRWCFLRPRNRDTSQ